MSHYSDCKSLQKLADMWREVMIYDKPYKFRDTVYSVRYFSANVYTGETWHLECKPAPPHKHTDTAKETFKTERLTLYKNNTTAVDIAQSRL